MAFPSAGDPKPISLVPMPHHHSFSISAIRLAAILLVAAWGGQVARANDVWISDLPVAASSVPSSRFAQPPSQQSDESGDGFLVLPLQPVVADQDLLVTLLFQEGFEKGPAVFWKNETSGEQVTLSENLAEGVEGPNQRSLLIPASLTNSPGRLVIQGRREQLLRIRLDWAIPRVVTAAADQRPISFIAADRLLASTELDGLPPLSLPDSWFGQVIEASLQEEPLALGEAVEFVSNLDQSASQALLLTKVLGLPLDADIPVWLNGSLAGHLRPALPSLTDPGYLNDSQGSAIYAGWRTAVLSLSADHLKPGDNSIVIGAAGALVFIKDTSLQLRPARSEAALAQ